MKIKFLCILTLIFSLTLQGFTIAHGDNSSSRKFELLPLPYNYDALEPYIDTETMILHHDKHLKTYVDNLNALISKHPELYSKSLEELLYDTSNLPEDIRQGVINNGGGVYNHNFFFNVIGPKGTVKPTGKLLESINKTFGSFENFQSKFKEAALGRFGSGWVFLVSNDKGELSIVSTSNQDSPISQGLNPIIAIDVWEHAYYLKYNNRRNDYIGNFWNVVNWEQAEKKFTK